MISRHHILIQGKYHLPESSPLVILATQSVKQQSITTTISKEIFHCLEAKQPIWKITTHNNMVSVAAGEGRDKKLGDIGRAEWQAAKLLKQATDVPLSLVSPTTWPSYLVSCGVDIYRKGRVSLPSHAPNLICFWITDMLRHLSEKHFQMAVPSHNAICKYRHAKRNT